MLANLDSLTRPAPVPGEVVVVTCVIVGEDVGLYEGEGVVLGRWEKLWR